MNCFLLFSCYLPWKPNLMFFNAVGSPFFLWQKSLWSNKSAWSVSIVSVTSESFNAGKSMSCRCRCIFLISETSYRLKGFFKLCTFQVDICVQLCTDFELISNDSVAESILCDFDRVLVTLSFFCFAWRFNLSATSFLNKVVPQSNKALKVYPFDSFIGIICRKVCFAPSYVFTAASLCWGNWGVWSFSPIVVCWLIW